MNNIENEKEKNKRPYTITRVLRLIIVITMISSVVLAVLHINSSDGGASQYFMSAFTCLVLLIITFIPSFVSDREIIILPTALQTAFVIFSFAAMYLGEIFSFYDRFWWWDILLHSMSAVMLGFAGFLLLHTLNKNRSVMFRLNPIAIALFAFCFAMACGTLWEVFEFSGDMLIGMNMQKSVYIKEATPASNWLPESEYMYEDEYFEKNLNSWGRVNDPGLMDTMKDLIVDGLGAFTAVTIGYIALKFGDRKKFGVVEQLTGMEYYGSEEKEKTNNR